MKALMAMGQIMLVMAITGTTACTTRPPVGERPVGAFLSEAERPDLLALLPAPPEDETPLAAADRQASEQALSLANTARWEMALLDASMRAPGGAAVFSCAVGLPLGEEVTPLTWSLLRSIAIDVALATAAPKRAYQRARPFAWNEQPICTPAGLRALTKDGSYPSAHAATGWAWALVLAELVPERTNAILQRGYAYGQSRVVCNVHWQSDVDQGRVAGTAIIASLHGDDEFREQLDAARDEIDKYDRFDSDANQDCVGQ